MNTGERKKRRGRQTIREAGNYRERSENLWREVGVEWAKWVWVLRSTLVIMNTGCYMLILP